MKWVAFIPPRYRRQVLQAAQHDRAPVYLSGESGSGKSAIARWIHANSPRSRQPFVVLGREQSLVEQILAAKSGTLFIELGGEITAMLSIEEQRLLLQALRTQSVELPGEVRKILPARIILSSPHQLTDSDPYYPYFANFRIHLPSLSERKNEFEDIVLGILSEISHEIKKQHLKGLEPDAWFSLIAHTWPGNLRELRNVLKLAAIKCQTDRISIYDLPDFQKEDPELHANRELFEKATIRELLVALKGDLNETAKTLRVERKQLDARIKELGISEMTDGMRP